MSSEATIEDIRCKKIFPEEKITALFLETQTNEKFKFSEPNKPPEYVERRSHSSEATDTAALRCLTLAVIKCFPTNTASSSTLILSLFN